MSDRDVPPPPDDDREDEGLPFFWGFIVIAVVIGIALWLFSGVDFGTAGESRATSYFVAGSAPIRF